MVFSSLATDLSANSARVSACDTNRMHESAHRMRSRNTVQTSGKQQKPHQIFDNKHLTSLSLSVRTLISSSYLSSFCEYCNPKNKRLNKECEKFSISITVCLLSITKIGDRLTDGQAFFRRLNKMFLHDIAHNIVCELLVTRSLLLEKHYCFIRCVLGVYHMCVVEHNQVPLCIFRDFKAVIWSVLWFITHALFFIILPSQPGLPVTSSCW